MSESDGVTIRFSTSVDSKGRLVIPQEHREAMSIDDRKTLVEFEATRIAYLDDEDGGDS